jgi:formate dehydrogenase subunit delta
MGEIHTTPSERLVMMANQIAKAFAAQGEARAVPKIAGHIKAFWDPRMRRKIDAHVTSGGAGLEPYALTALKQLMAGTEKPASPDEHSPFNQGSDAG